MGPDPAPCPPPAPVARRGSRSRSLPAAHRAAAAPANLTRAYAAASRRVAPALTTADCRVARRPTAALAETAHRPGTAKTPGTGKTPRTAGDLTFGCRTTQDRATGNSGINGDPVMARGESFRQLFAIHPEAFLVRQDSHHAARPESAVRHQKK